MADDTPHRTICLVLSEHLTNHYTGPLVMGAVAAAARLGIRLILYSPLNIHMNRRDFTLAELPLLPRRVDAYLVPANVADEVLDLCRSGGARLLTYAGVRGELPSIGPDNRAGARAATAHLIRAGRRRIAHLAGLPDSGESHEREAGYREALADAGLPFDRELLDYGHFRIQEAEDAVSLLLARGVPFDAIFAANDLEARGAITVLTRAGLRVPDDVAVVGFDDSAGSDTMEPPLTTVRQSAFQLGWDALTLLAAPDAEELPLRTLTPTRLVVRRSCGSLGDSGAGAPDWAAELVGHLEFGQGPLVSRDEVIGWTAGLERALRAPAGWEAELDAALEAAEARGWYAPALRRYLDLWRERRIAAGADPALTAARVAAAKDQLAQALEERRKRERHHRIGRLNAITYVIDLMREYSYDQSIEAVLRYMVNSGPRGAVAAQRAAPLDGIVAQRVDATDGVGQWSGPPEAFPPSSWLAPGDTLLLMPIDAGAQQRTLMGVVEREDRSHLELDDLLLRSINSYRSVTTLHETLRELEAARSVQLSLLPPRPPASEDYDIAGATRTARQVGGDLYGYYARSGGALALALGDVAGKGLPAALLMSACSVALAGAIPAGLPPATTLSQIHHMLQPSVGRGQNAAVCLVYLDGARVRVANAGAVAPVLRDGRGVRLIDVGGLPLGTPLSDAHPYDEVELRLAAGDMLILSSDGIVEAMSERGELYGFERFARAIAGGPLESAQAMLAYILADVGAFVGEAEMHDDMALVVARYRGPAG
jgi:DNA-binding LacI/PurR family transcriptional regulator/serine/threonine protein phosphatase PrpC